jgi:paraquat-inducible protein B
MSKKASPTVIGGFVVGAIGLLVLALVVLGGQELFRERVHYISVFDGSVAGLRVGANVNFFGVRVGEVSDIHLRYDPATRKTDIAVIMDLGQGTLRTVSGERYVSRAGDQTVQDLIDAGLRAELSMESFVTGQLVVELDFHADSEAVYRAYDQPLPEMPTVPSGIERVLEGARTFAERIRSLPLEAIASDVARVAAGAADLAENDHLESILAGVDTLVNDDDLQALAGSVESTLTELRSSLATLRQVAAHVDSKVEPLAEGAVAMLAEAESALEQVDQTVALLRADLAGDTDARYTLFQAVREVEKAARSIRLFVELLEQQPEALLKGKEGEP